MLIAAAVNVECVNSVFAEDLDKPLAVLERSASGDAMIHRDAVDNGHVVARAALDRLQYLDRKTCSVLVASAIFVLTLVPQRSEELVDYISNMTVDFDRVIARVCCNLGRELP